MAIVVRKRKNGNPSYLVRVKDDEGNWFPAETYDDELAAKERENELVRIKRKGGKALSDDAKKVLFDEYWSVWSKENRSDVSEGWKISQNQMYRTYIKPVLGESKMVEISAPEIGRVLNRAQEMGLGDQTRKHIYSLLRKMFNDAVEYYEMLVSSPVKPKFHRPKISGTKRNFLLPAQAWHLLEHSKDHYLGPAIWIQVLSGLRPSEVQALRWRSVMFDLNQLLICEAYNNKTKQLQPFPKQEDWDYSPIPPQLKAYLKSLPVPSEDSFVVQGPGGGMLSYRTYLPSLKRFCEKVGVPPVTPHELRHTCTEIYVQAGASAEDIRRLLNHSSLTATKNYIHRTDERLNSIAGSIESSYTNIFTNVKKEAVHADKEEVRSVH